MTEGRTVVRVQIGGDEYALRSDRSAEHTRAVAEYVDRALREVRETGAVVETHKQAILAALAVADDLFRARSGQDELTGHLQALTGRLERLLPPRRRPSGSQELFAPDGEAG